MTYLHVQSLFSYVCRVGVSTPIPLTVCPNPAMVKVKDKQHTETLLKKTCGSKLQATSTLPSFETVV